MADDLRDRIASAIRETVPLHQGGYKTADAVLAVVGPELERLRAALDGAGQHVGTVIQRAEQAEAERDALKAAIRAVTSDWATRARSAATWVDEAKTDVEKVRWNVWRTAYECLASELLAALDTPTPTEETDRV